MPREIEMLDAIKAGNRQVLNAKLWSFRKIKNRGGEKNLLISTPRELFNILVYFLSVFFL